MSALLALAWGCAGGGRLELSSLDYRSIDPPAARGASVPLDRCHWWTDDEGRLWVAMESVSRPLFGALGPAVLQLSLELEGLPAGQARNYLAGQRQLRAVARFGPAESRFVSAAGIVAVYRAGGDRLRGSFRLQVRRQTGRLLGGWSAPTSWLMQGTFVATHEPRRGSAIAGATEAHGWGRDDFPQPATPATQPAAPE